jgi:hypothetical protein
MSSSFFGSRPSADGSDEAGVGLHLRGSSLCKFARKMRGWLERGNTGVTQRGVDELLQGRLLVRIE